MNRKKPGFSTRAIHSGEREEERGAVTTPIYQTVPFKFKSAAYGAAVMAGEDKGYVYSRGLNPTTEVLEEKQTLRAARRRLPRQPAWLPSGQ